MYLPVRCTYNFLLLYLYLLLIISYYWICDRSVVSMLLQCHSMLLITAMSRDHLLLGDQTDTWLQAEVTIGARQQFRVHFVGYVGVSYDGDIAIDDIEFINCAGSGLHGDMDCDFEFGNCDYAQAFNTDVLDWRLMQGEGNAWMSRPDTDHSTESTLGELVLENGGYVTPFDNLLKNKIC